MGERFDGGNITQRRNRADDKPIAGTRLIREWQGVEQFHRLGLQPAKGQFLKAVGEAALEKPAIVRWRVGLEQLLPLAAQIEAAFRLTRRASTLSLIWRHSPENFLRSADRSDLTAGLFHDAGGGA